MSSKVYFITNELVSKENRSVAFKKKIIWSSRAQTLYHHNHKAFKGHSYEYNIWYYFYYNASQLMGLRYSPVLKQNLVQTSNSIQSYHTMNY